MYRTPVNILRLRPMSPFIKLSIPGMRPGSRCLPQHGAITTTDEYISHFLPCSSLDLGDFLQCRKIRGRHLWRMIGKSHEWRYEHGGHPLRAFSQELHMAEHRLKELVFKSVSSSPPKMYNGNVPRLPTIMMTIFICGTSLQVFSSKANSSTGLA